MSDVFVLKIERGPLANPCPLSIGTFHSDNVLLVVGLYDLHISVSISFAHLFSFLFFFLLQKNIIQVSASVLYFSMFQRSGGDGDDDDGVRGGGGGGVDGL